MKKYLIIIILFIFIIFYFNNLSKNDMKNLEYLKIKDNIKNRDKLGGDFEVEKTILIHGLGQTSESYDDVLKYVKNKKEYDVFDLFNLKNDINFKNIYDNFSKKMENYDGKINLCGLSLGGIIALKYTINNPEKVNKLILIATPDKTPKILFNLQIFIFKFLPESTFKSIGLNKSEVINLMKSCVDIDLRKDLKYIENPVLIICGKKDNINKLICSKMNKLILNSEFKIIENAGHEVNMDNPKKLAEIIDNFIH